MNDEGSRAHGQPSHGEQQPDRTPLAPPLYTPPTTAAEQPVPTASGQPAPAAASGSRTTLIIAIVAAVVIIGGFLGFGLLAGVISSTPGVSSGQGVGSGQEPTEEDPPTNDTEAMLDEKLDEYRAARDDGSLWEQIPDTQFNRTAVVAFLFFLTDMKVAASWGIDRETAAEYEEEVAELERRLLAEEPLGSDIEIAFSEDRIFRYDGETGEGGYFEE